MILLKTDFSYLKKGRKTEDRRRKRFRLRSSVFQLVVLLPIAFCLLPTFSFGQGMGISEVAITPNTSSILELRSTTKGLLIPRMTAAQIAAMNPLPAAAQGLLVYQTDGTQGYYYNTSITTTPTWVFIAAGGQPWTDLGAIVHNTTLADQVSVGTSTPTAGVKFEVQSTGGIGIFGQESGSNSDNYGIYGFASGATNNNIGILAYGQGTSVLDADTTYGLLAVADVVASSNGIGVAGIIAATNPDYAIGVQGYAEQKALSVSGNFYGGYFSPNAFGTGATGFGIYADAAGFATNWAGYFGAGNVYIENNLGIGTTSPTNILSFGGDVARTIWMERNTGAATPAFLIQGAGATVGATNRLGGQLQLSSGISTGNLGSTIAFFTASGGASGTADNSPTQKMLLSAGGALTIGAVAGLNSFDKLVILDGHLRITQTTAPTIAVLANAGTGATASVLAGSANNAGQFTLISSATADAIGNVCTITFNGVGFAAGITVVITPANVTATTKQAYVSSTSLTTFTIGYGSLPGTATCIFNYIVIGN